MDNINPFIAVSVALLVVVAAFVWWSRRTNVDSKGKRVADFVFLWPLLLQGRRSGRERIFMAVGIVIAVALICLSFTLPKP